MQVPIKSLIVFEAVTRLGSFTKAAEELSVSQSAISHQMKNLESFFGVKLLDRTDPSMPLTEEGAILYENLSEAMNLMRRGVSTLKARTTSFPVGISVRPHFAFKWLSPRLHDANFGFDLRFTHSHEVADLSSPDIHVSIEWWREQSAPKDARFLLPGNLTPACHPCLLDGIADPSDPNILAQFALLHETDTVSWQEWLSLAGVPDLQPLRNEYYSDTNVRQHASVNKQGFSLVCPELIRDEIMEGTLVCPFNQYLDNYGYYLRVPEDRLQIPNVRKFVNWLEKEVSKMDRHVWQKETPVPSEKRTIN
jgi:LysR family glycine cleavage system transcriptional activator